VQIATHAVKDRPSTWGSSLEPPPSFDISGYQKQLNKIGGFTQQGEPVLRLVWGGNEANRKAIRFDDFGNPVEWGMVPRYSFESKKIETWGQRIPIRRWIIEENTDAGQLEAMGGKNHGNIEVPEKGYYTPYIIIADHSKCKQCAAADFKCFGDYKAPNYDELIFLTEVTYKLLSSRKQDPRKGLDMELVADIVQSEKPDEQEERAKDEQENRAYVRDWLNTHLPIRSFGGAPKSTNYANSNSKPADQV
jgi:hypothetical protein